MVGEQPAMPTDARQTGFELCRLREGRIVARLMSRG
jgi:hypothetical protein